VAGTLLFNALREAIDEEMANDVNVCVMGEDVGQYGGSYKVTKDLYEKYGELRVLDTPIAENSFTGMAVGAAMTGLRPIVEGMNMGFLLLAFNQISNNMGMLRYTSGGNYKIPAVVRGPGGVGRQLGAVHSQRLEAYFHAVPGIKIVACSPPTNAKGLMKAAIRDDNPVLFFEHVLLYNLSEELPEGDYTCALDQADVVKEGKDITLLTYSRMRHHCLKAVEELEKKEIDVELIDLISLKPFDMETIAKSIRKTNKVIIVEECMKTGGIGAELIALITEECFDDLDARPIRLSSQDIPTPYNGNLENLTIIQPHQIVEKVEDLNSGSILAMYRRQGWLFFIIFLLTLSVYLFINYPLQLGLDLIGGSQLTLQIIKEEGKVTRDELEAVNSVIDKRVNNLGVSESNLQTLGGDQLILELPGEQNPLVASRVLGKTALLEFRTQKEGTSSDLKNLQLQRLSIKELIEQYSIEEKNQNNDNFLKVIQDDLKNIEQELNYSSTSNDLYEKLIEIKKYVDKEITNLFIKTDLSGKDLINAGRRQEQTSSNWEVLLTFSNSGGEKFAEITKSIAGTNQLLAIILDGESISEASVGNQFASTGITGGSATISGNFSAENARELEVQLKGGSLPLPIEIVETNTIGALLGSKNILKSLYAAISGLIFVGIFMIFNYRILGFVSVLSLALYGFF